MLQKVKLIAEPWDTGPAGYQVGNFPFHWSEWNDRYRESIRAFWRNEPGRLPEVAARLTGSIDLFKGSGRRPSASINYVASHDGLTLNDLAGGDDRLRRNLLATVFLSMGTPMLLAGDEWGRSQQGNDNAYNQDNAISWLDWSKADASLRAFVTNLITLRPHLPWIQRDQWAGFGLDIRWLRPDGAELTAEDWEQSHSHVAMYRVAQRLAGGPADQRRRRDDRLPAAAARERPLAAGAGFVEGHPEGVATHPEDARAAGPIGGVAAERRAGAEAMIVATRPYPVGPEPASRVQKCTCASGRPTIAR